MILMSRAEEIILLAIWKLGKEAYGVTIREQVFKDIGRYWSFGVIYKTLKKMNRKNYVRKINSGPVSERGGRSKFFYELTPKGVIALEEIQKIHDSTWNGVKSFANNV
ncbi:MAG: PadR family transcriptional regulator [bacterium]|nr:PadR family transcriptional regulator [bacterium]